MRESDGREQPGESSGATGKRNHIYFEGYGEERKKRQKWVSQAQTLTVNSDSNQFQTFPSSSSSSSRWNSINRNASWGSRKWVYSSGDFSNYKDKVVIVSYNILGVENAAKHPDSYVNVPQKFLSWSWRKNLIRKEINGYKASIICFQEVDRFDDLCDFLKKDGFKGVYMPRTGEACDGCAIFWKNKVFSLLHEENIEFQSFGLNHNVAQLCVLKMNKKQGQSKSHRQESKSKLTPNRSLVVGNIHVLYNPRRGDIKLGQVRLFLEKAHCLSKEWGDIPVILAGDFNSTPQSPMYQFLESSRLNVQLLDRRNISGQQEYESRGNGFAFRNNYMRRCTTSVSHSKTWMNGWSEEELMLATGSRTSTHLRHNLKLYSAYLGVPGSRATRDNYGEPLATSHHSMFTGTVDYIWHTEELIPVRVLDTLPMHILRRSGGLPSKVWGSDHLALVCELAFTDEDDDNKNMLLCLARRTS